MANKEFIEGWLGRYDYVDVYRDNGSSRRRFKYREEEDDADAYYNYLQSLDNEEISIKKQEEIFEQLKRQNDSNQNKNNAHESYSNQRFQKPNVSSVDPDLKEWIQFQKETSLEYKKWKKEKEAEAERIRKQQEEEAEIQRKSFEFQERKRKEQEIERKKRQEEELKKNQRIIEPLVSSLLQRKKLSWEQRCQIAKYTNNKSAIKKLKYDNSVKVLDALLTNPYLDSATIQHIHNRKKDKIASKNAYQTIREESREESREDSGCLKPLITIVLILGSIIFLINFIASKL